MIPRAVTGHMRIISTPRLRLFSTLINPTFAFSHIKESIQFLNELSRNWSSHSLFFAQDLAIFHFLTSLSHAVFCPIIHISGLTLSQILFTSFNTESHIALNSNTSTDLSRKSNPYLKHCLNVGNSE